MGGAQQPFLYSAESYGSDPRFPTAPFEPKAVTRASYQAKPKKKKKNGPLISVNRHPEYVSPGHSFRLARGVHDEEYKHAQTIGNIANVRYAACMALSLSGRSTHP